MGCTNVFLFPLGSGQMKMVWGFLYLLLEGLENYRITPYNTIILHTAIIAKIFGCHQNVIYSVLAENTSFFSWPTLYVSTNIEQFLTMLAKTVSLCFSY
jgi:hypothetical protein